MEENERAQSLSTPTDQLQIDRLGEALIALGADPGISTESAARVGLHLLSRHQKGRAWTPEGLDLASLTPAQRHRVMAALKHREEASARVLERARRASIGVLTLADPTYPAALLQLELPPPVLYSRGSLPVGPAVSIVGARRATPYGLEVSRWLARELAEAGLTIVSGFARGIDAAAHRGALEASAGATIAVLGCGVDVDYPWGQRGLAREISQNGCMLSELSPGTGPRRQNFPIRNRIIAALGAGTIVVQAGRRSGALITVRQALELGREVLVAPGRLFEPVSEGVHHLLRDGAHVITEVGDVLLAIGYQPTTRQPQEGPPASSDSHDDQLLQAISSEARTAERIATEIGLGLADILARLVELEIRGKVRRHPGGRYLAAR